MDTMRKGRDGSDDEAAETASIVPIIAGKRALDNRDSAQEKYGTDNRTEKGVYL